MAAQFSKSFRLTKVDESTRRAYGLVTAEVPDSDNEICDYMAARRAFADWAEKTYKDTSAAGQDPSFGNIRLMHNPVIAGKATKAPEFRDKEREIWLETTPVSDAVWNMLKGGFITGFSQGGSYLWRRCEECQTAIDDGWECPTCERRVKVRYAPSVVEVSYVDKPAVGEATFSYVKRDGSVELRKFRTERNTMPEDKRPPEPVFTRADIDHIVKSAVAALRKSDAQTKRVAGEDLTSDCFAYVGDKEDTSTWKLPIKFSTDEKTKRHIRNALARFDQTKGIPEAEKESVKAKILAAAKKHGIDAEGDREKVARFTGAAEVALEKAGVKKGMYEVARFAAMIQDLAYLHESAVYEASWENDESEVPHELAEAIEHLVEVFLDSAEEETTELVSATAGKSEVKKGSNMANTNALAKAHKSVAEHLGKLKEMIDDHHEKMGKMRDAHRVAVHDHIAKMSKILGAEEAAADDGTGAGEEPKPINPAAGTPAGPGPAKAAGDTFSKADVESIVQKALRDAGVIKDPEPKAYTKSEVEDMVKSALVAFAKGDSEEEEKAECESCGGTGQKDGEKCSACMGKGTVEKAAPARGIGKRDGSAAQPGPVLRVVPVTKTQDGVALNHPNLPAASADLSQEELNKAMSGDRDAQLKLMRKSQLSAEGIPPTVASALSEHGR
jgi:hypothetical protein